MAGGGKFSAFEVPIILARILCPRYLRERSDTVSRLKRLFVSTDLSIHRGTGVSNHLEPSTIFGEESKNLAMAALLRRTDFFVEQHV